MEKEKRYQHIEFPSKVLRLAIEEISKVFPDEESPSFRHSRRRVSTADSESWEFDSDDEFYSALRLPHDQYSFGFQINSTSVNVRYSGTYSTVTVSANDRIIIERIFEIFEEASQELSRIPKEKDHSAGQLSESSRFTRNIAIPSCSVDIKLIESIEEYIMTKLPAQLGLADSDIRGNYTVTIRTNSGKLELPSIRSFPSERFTDGTSRVSLAVHLYASTKFSLDLDIDIERIHSELTIRYTAPNSKEVSLGLSNSLSQIMNTKSNLNWLFHPKYGLGEILTFIFMSISIGGSLIIIKLFPQSWFYTIMTLILFWGVVYIGKKSHPYTEFDTSTQQRWNQLWLWFFWGFMGLIVIETAIGFLGKKFISFFSG